MKSWTSCSKSEKRALLPIPSTKCGFPSKYGQSRGKIAHGICDYACRIVIVTFREKKTEGSED